MSSGDTFNGVYEVFGGMTTIILLILGFTMMYFHLKNEMLKTVFWLTVLILFFSCACVLIGSLIPSILGLIVSFLKVIIENLLSSYLFHVALLFGLLIVICQRQPALV